MLPVPEKVWNIVLKRCKNLPQASINMRVMDQDFLDTLMVSCYLQGLQDLAEGRYRKEGDYEEER